MSCSPFDLRDYFLKELADPQRLQVDVHLKSCPQCREEVDRLRLTATALYCLRDEEIPQRIAFVSDKIFEPAPWRRWLAGFWGSASRLGFASAAMLSAAILVHAWRPAAAPATAPAPAPPAVQSTTVIQKISDAEIQARVDAAVLQTVQKVTARESVKIRQLVAELEAARQQVVIADGENWFNQKRLEVARASVYSMPPEPGDPK